MRPPADPGSKCPANEPVRRSSSPGVVVPDSACHAGGRGFASRRFRLSKCLHLGRLCCPSGREQWAGGPIPWPKRITQNACRRGNFCPIRTNQTVSPQAGCPLSLKRRESVSSLRKQQVLRPLRSMGLDATALRRAQNRQQAAGMRRVHQVEHARAHADTQDTARGPKWCKEGLTVRVRQRALQKARK